MSFQNTTVPVIGGARFIGAHPVTHLLAGASLRVPDAFSPGRRVHHGAEPDRTAS